MNETTTQNKAGERTQHTPGPWKIKYTKDSANRLQPNIMAGTLFVATLFSDFEHTRAEANARLIAAAPELLAVVQRFARYWEQNSVPELQGIACDAFAAIAKAEGRAS